MNPLEQIEEIVSDDFCHDVSGWLASGIFKDNDTTTKMAQKLMRIYEISHTNNPHTCSHPGWK